eukprot:12583-Heterococcus_DN1.PRE.6
MYRTGPSSSGSSSINYGHSAAAAAAPPAAAKASSSSVFSRGGSKGKASPETLADATELSKFAIKALEVKDVALAKQRLQEALNCLG